MKKQILIAAMLFSILAVLPAYSQSTSVKVPFSFTMGDKTYPAGDYKFSSHDNSIVLESNDHRSLAMVLANHVAGRSAGKSGKVMFECYGNECFVSTIWIAGQDEGRQVLRSRTETLVAAKMSGKYMALLGMTTPVR